MSSAPPVLDIDGPITVAALRELTEVDQQDSALGQATLFAARQLDSGRATGTAAAAVLARFEVLLAKAAASGHSQASPTDRARDELAQLRAARRGA